LGGAAFKVLMEEIMFILLAVTFGLGVFLGVMIICLLIMAKKSQRGQEVDGVQRELRAAPYNY
jgi:hypothetical protein